MKRHDRRGGRNTLQQKGRGRRKEHKYIEEVGCRRHEDRRRIEVETCEEMCGRGKRDREREREREERE